MAMAIAMDLLELKKYAIEHRVEIRFGDHRTNHECVINSKGLVKIPGEDKDFRVEDVLEAADAFEIVSNGSAQRYNREAMTRIIAEASAGKGAGAHVEEEE
jgi:hypothetical protein